MGAGQSSEIVETSDPLSFTPPHREREPEEVVDGCFHVLKVQLLKAICIICKIEHSIRIMISLKQEGTAQKSCCCTVKIKDYVGTDSLQTHLLNF